MLRGQNAKPKKRFAQKRKVGGITNYNFILDEGVENLGGGDRVIRYFGKDKVRLAGIELEPVQR